MKAIIDNLRIIMPFFTVSWALFIIRTIRKPQRLGNCYLLMMALFFSAVLVAGFFGDNIGYALLWIFILGCLVLFAVPVMLVINGVVMIKRESFSVSHVLSLVLGLIIGAGEIATVLGVVSTTDYLVPSEFGLPIIFVAASVFYFSVIILGFVLYVLFIQFMPHRMNFDYVIIHGSGLIDGNKVPKLLANRIDKAIEIYNKCKKKPIIIPSGGKGTDESLSEAQAMKDYLTGKGIPAENIVMEDTSTTTMENLRNSKAIIDEMGNSKRVALVSSNYHIYRCIVYASKIGLKCTGIGANVALYYWPSAVIREFIAIHSETKKIIQLIAGYLFFVVLPTLGMFTVSIKI